MLCSRTPADWGTVLHKVVERDMSSRRTAEHCLEYKEAGQYLVDKGRSGSRDNLMGVAQAGWGGGKQAGRVRTAGEVAVGSSGECERRAAIPEEPFQMVLIPHLPSGRDCLLFVSGCNSFALSPGSQPSLILSFLMHQAHWTWCLSVDHVCLRTTASQSRVSTDHSQPITCLHGSQPANHVSQRVTASQSRVLTSHSHPIMCLHGS